VCDIVVLFLKGVNALVITILFLPHSAEAWCYGLCCSMFLNPKVKARVTQSVSLPFTAGGLPAYDRNTHKGVNALTYLRGDILVSGAKAPG
jgi:hypothetical protein